jgi:D-3-phosphoglycerate dehydrogenase
MPEITMPRSGVKRICVIHKNIPNILSAITSEIGKYNINIENLLNKSKGDNAYTMLDIGEADFDAIAKVIEGLEGVIRVRLI